MRVTVQGVGAACALGLGGGEGGPGGAAGGSAGRGPSRPAMFGDPLRGQSALTGSQQRGAGPAVTSGPPGDRSDLGEIIFLRAW